MGSNGDYTNMGSVQVKIHRGKTPGEMLKWHKRWLVASADGHELQLYKNDQEYTPKEVVRVSHISNAVSGDSDKKSSLLEITMRRDTKAAQGYTFKLRTQHVRDEWLRVIREMRDGVWKGHGHTLGTAKNGMKEALERWQVRLSGLRGGDLRVVIDDSSLSLHEHLESGLTPVDKLFRELRNSGKQSHPISRVVLTTGDTHSAPASFERITETLLIRLRWIGDGEDRYVSGPEISFLLPLVVAEMWQLNAERMLLHQASWKDAVGRLCSIVGKTIPVVLEWASDIHEDTAEVRSYVQKWATGACLDEVSNMIVQCFDPQSPTPYPELSLWVGAVTLLFSKADVATRAPPRVRMHRNTNRHDEGAPGPPKSLIHAFNKCRRRGDKYDTTLCEAFVQDLRGALSDTLSHIYMAELMRKAERITVGFDKLKLNFVINWESFLHAVAQLQALPNVRLKLAKELLSRYPARVQTVSKSLTEAEWGLLCGLMQKVSVAFVLEGSEERSFLAGGDLVDVCMICLHGESIVLMFDVKDLASYCRGLLAAVSRSEVAMLAKRSHSMLTARHCISDSSEASYSEASSASDVVSTHPRHFADHSCGSLDDTRHKSGPTQYAEDNTFVADHDLPLEILDQLRDDNDNGLDALYPVSTHLLEETIAALNKTFSNQRIESHSKQHAIIQAIKKLRRIFYLLDPERTGKVRAEGLMEIIRRFHEFSLGSKHKYDDLHRQIVGNSKEEAVPFADVARVLMTRLFPEDVKLSLLQRHHCLLLGLDNTGKSQILNALKNKGFEKTEATIGERTEVVKIDKMLLSISEIGGRGDVLKHWRSHSKHLQLIHKLAFCVDGANRSRFDQARIYLKDVLQSRHLKDWPLLLIINNQADTSNEAEICKALKVEKYCKSNRPYKVLTTNVTGAAPLTPEVFAELQKGFEWLAMSEKSKSR